MARASSGEHDVLLAIEQYLVDMRRRLSLPGLAVAIVQDAEVIYQHGFGMAAPDGRAVTQDTPFILGSLSKSFTALALMQLVEAGKVNLDVPVQHYIPWFAVADPIASSRITARHLLTHTSGFSRAVGRDLLAGRGGKTVEQSVREVCFVALVHEVGVTYEYSNTNYLVLSLLIEVISGESYPHYIEQHIFQPLSMQHSFTSEHEAAADGLAQGHHWWFGAPRAFDAPYLVDAQGAAFLVSSVADMARWLLLHLSGGSLGGIRLLSPAGIEELHRPEVPTGKGAMAAMGWRVEHLGGEEIHRHGGEVSNFRAEMILVPSRKLGVVILQNCNNGLVAQLGFDQLATNVLHLLMGLSLPQKKLTFRGFYILIDLLAVVVLALQVRSLVQLVRPLRRKSAHVDGGRLLVFAGEMIGGLMLLWRLPRWVDMRWRGLLLYVPDASCWLLGMSVLSLVKSGIRLSQVFFRR